MENFLLDGRYLSIMPIHATTLHDALMVANLLLPENTRNKKSRLILKSLIEGEGETDCYTVAKMFAPKVKRYSRKNYIKESWLYRDKIKKCAYKNLNRYLKEYGLYISFRDEKISVKKCKI